MSAIEIRQAPDVSRRPCERSASPPETVSSASRPSKIQPWHLARLAFVYVRQSSPHQVAHHKESAQVQAKLRDLAIAWGWPQDRVVVVTDDQGHSGTTADGRFGFIQIMTEVNLDHAGIILGFQVSRLSRANKDWYDLLERCAVFDTLLADEDGLYSPMAYNDRLLLGLKGTMSEAELHLMRQRLYHGRLNKAQRGEQFTAAPTGYVRSRSGEQLELDPDEQVQYVIRLIFDKFDELGSIGAVHRYLVRHDIKLGVRLPGAAGAGRLEWRPAGADALGRVLRHPYYGGCYAFGFTRQDARRKKPGRPRSGTVQVPRLKWQVMIPDAVPAYITWDRYLANQRRLDSNRFLPRRPAPCGMAPHFSAAWSIAGDADRRCGSPTTPRECLFIMCALIDMQNRWSQHVSASRESNSRTSSSPRCCGRSSQRDWSCTSRLWPISAGAAATRRALAKATGTGSDPGRSSGPAVSCRRAGGPVGGPRAGTALGGDTT